MKWQKIMPALDGLCVIGAFCAAYIARLFFFHQSIQRFLFYFPLIVFSLGSFLMLFFVFRLYRETRQHFSIPYFIDFLEAFCAWGFFLVAFSYFTKGEYSRFIVTLFFITSVILVYVSRLFVAWMTEQRAPRNGDTEIVRAVKAMVEEKNVLAIEYVHQTAYRFVKRILDFFIALALSILLAPVMLVIFFLIRRDSGGRALILQKRVGKSGKAFFMYKFRTMYIDTHLYAPAPRDEHDSRITRAGRWLRRYSLDELPQLWNVVRGDMSIVGPRPEMAFIVEKYEPWQKIRLQVKPGITGLWQVIGRKDLPLEENLEYDVYYVFHLSLFLDLAIILKTIPRLFLSRGAY